MTATCRFCRATLTDTFIDLGMSPLSNAYIDPANRSRAEKFYPLHAFVCSSCKLVQIEEVESIERIFDGNYAYFSSYSQSWLAHAREYADTVIARFDLNSQSQVVEIASNDGYLLKNFINYGVPALGIEPTRNTAEVAIKSGIQTWIKFFDVETAKELVTAAKSADLLIGNNVLAHVPDLNDFVAGLKIALKPHGVISIEFPHLMNLIQLNQFDTIYHEHFSYFSLFTVEKIFKHHGLELFDVEELSTHGGSLRIYAQHENGPHQIQRHLQILRNKELSIGFDKNKIYSDFQSKADRIKRDLLTLLIEAQENALKVVCYGAPAKGNTLLNYCGIRTDLISFTVDISPYKQGKLLPGTRIPVYSPEKLVEFKPDIVLILPWNIKEEIVADHSYIRDWGGRFVVPIPCVEFLT